MHNYRKKKKKKKVQHLNGFLKKPSYARELGSRKNSTLIAGLQGTDIVAHDCDEKSLLIMLKSSKHSVVTKILSTMLFIFPLVKTKAFDSFVVAPATFKLPTDPTTTSGLASYPIAKNSGELLSYLAFYSMCPAYSQESKIADRNFKRAKAIAASDMRALNLQS